MNEPKQWILRNAACTIEERASLDKSQLRIATTCTDQNQDTCCSFYDPSMQPYIPRRRQYDDDENDD